MSWVPTGGGRGQGGGRGRGRGRGAAGAKRKAEDPEEEQPGVEGEKEGQQDPSEGSSVAAGSGHLEGGSAASDLVLEAKVKPSPTAAKPAPKKRGRKA